MMQLVVKNAFTPQYNRNNRYGLQVLHSFLWVDEQFVASDGFEYDALQ